MIDGQLKFSHGRWLKFFHCKLRISILTMHISMPHPSTSYNQIRSDQEAMDDLLLDEEMGVADLG